MNNINERKDVEISKEEEFKSIENLELKNNYLSFCNNEEEVKQALLVIENTARKYYNSNPSLYKNNQLTVDDLVQTIHLHLLMKSRNVSNKSKNPDGFKVTGFNNLKACCTNSMNAVLRQINYDKTCKTTEVVNGKKQKVEYKVQISSLSEMYNNNSNSESDTSETNLKEVIFSDNGKSEDEVSATMQLKLFCNKIKKYGKEYEILFRVNSYLNNGINCLGQKDKQKV